MQYISTRDASNSISSAQAICRGISPDGGLYVPAEFPAIELDEIGQMRYWPYEKIAQAVLKRYLTDYSETELMEIATEAYQKFEDEKRVPLYPLSDREQVLELFHGPTLAFKDVALQMLPHLLGHAAKKIGQQEKILILVATSGDTGKAALEGFASVPHTAINVFYPQEGVSAMQKLQMITQRGENVYVCGVNGNFDDAQTGVKNLFGDAALEETLKNMGVKLSSANSINFGRLVPQVVYYFAAYAQLLDQEKIQLGEKVNFVVPTGNFGNILAGYYAMRMGLPVNKLICASNRNHVLTDFFEDGAYEARRPFYKTLSPSMDILVSSNLERLLFELVDRDEKQVAEWMQALKQNGRYEIGLEAAGKLRETFYAGYCDDDQTRQTIREVFEKTHYLMDPHTAVGQRVYKEYREKTGDDTMSVVLSTASPYKFGADVLFALTGEEQVGNEFEKAQALSQLTGRAVPNQILSLKTLPVLHRDSCEKQQMMDRVLNWIKRV